MAALVAPTVERFRDTIGRFVSGVTVITTSVDGVPYGTTVSALTSVSLDPPTLLICLNRESATGQAISVSGWFAVNVLRDGQQDLAARFAMKGDAKFAGVTTRRDADRPPLLPAALATLQCRVVQEVEAATHTVYIATVELAAADGGEPLAYFRGSFHRLAAPS